MIDPSTFYNNQITIHSTSLNKTKRQLAISSGLRLLVFLITVIAIYFFYPNKTAIGITLLTGIPVFVFLIYRHTSLTYQKNKLIKLIDINQTELDVSKGDISMLDNGSVYINPNHPYSYDIDIFGDHSFFQYINRTTTMAGKNKLSELLTENSILDIEKKQKAVKNLANIPRWRQDFSATASMVKATTSIHTIQKWLSSYTSFVPSFMKIGPQIFSIISMLVICLYVIETIPFNIVLLWFFIGLGITGTKIKKINKLYHDTSRIKDTFEQYYKLIEKIENHDFESILLQEKQKNINSTTITASKTLKQFANILNAFDQRNNMLFGALSNGLLLWDIRQCYRIEKWIYSNQNHVQQWFEVIAFFDAYNCLGNFDFNHPKYIYPQITDNSTIISAKELGHPMLKADKRVDNDITIDKEQFFIITGANMAGKSTFLRTVALQIVMANIGLPICAKSCEYTPIKLISSMRTSDSLSDNASYFFSELTQLKTIVDALDKENYFIILDEILKGTNSKDKAAGSRKFVKKLVDAKATGIIATHDLSLCEVSKELPQVKNRFFDAQIINDELFFDYKFKDGVCQNMNASFLLKKMGIV